MFIKTKKENQNYCEWVLVGKLWFLESTTYLTEQKNFSEKVNANFWL